MLVLYFLGFRCWSCVVACAWSHIEMEVGLNGAGCGMSRRSFCIGQIHCQHLDTIFIWESPQLVFRHFLWLWQYCQVWLHLKRNNKDFTLSIRFWLVTSVYGLQENLNLDVMMNLAWSVYLAKLSRFMKLVNERVTLEKVKSFITEIQWFFVKDSFCQNGDWSSLFHTKLYCFLSLLTICTIYIFLCEVVSICI
jgi:hypothetical protein